MKYLNYVFVLLCVGFLATCSSEKAQTLETGWYYLAGKDRIDLVEKIKLNTQDTFYINPTPVVTVPHFKEVMIYSGMVGNEGMQVIMNEEGTKLYLKEEDVEEDVEDDNEEGNENEGTDVLTISEEILELVNQHRVSIGKLALIRSSVADEIATEHSNYMISRGAISHDNFSDRFQELRQLVNANSAGENIAAGYPTAATVMQGWINSPGHKANIEGNFTHIGIAAVKDSQGRYYYTQLFYR